MSLELNLTDADRADKGFKEYPKSCIVQRPLIVSEGRIPMRVAHLMGMRILHPESDFMSNYFFCDDRVAYSSDNQRVKIGSRGLLKPYEEHGLLVTGAIEFNEEHYQQLLWKEFGKGALDGRGLSQIEARAMPFWFELSQRNQALLNAYVSMTYTSGKLERAMGIYLDSGWRANAWMRALYVNWLGDSRWSGAFGIANLGNDDGRLVGVAPEALVRLEQRLYDEKRIHVDFVRALTEEEGDVHRVKKKILGSVGEGETWEEAVMRNPELKNHIEIEAAQGQVYLSREELSVEVQKLVQAGQITPEAGALLIQNALRNKREEA